MRGHAFPILASALKTSVPNQFTARFQFARMLLSVRMEIRHSPHCVLRESPAIFDNPLSPSAYLLECPSESPRECNAMQHKFGKSGRRFMLLSMAGSPGSPAAASLNSDETNPICPRSTCNIPIHVQPPPHLSQPPCFLKIPVRCRAKASDIMQHKFEKSGTRCTFQGAQ